ncbi:MAG: hypothetical protein G8237_12530 [Magnetococcales bacterium]|nr:hypothetical protein [Magnetococcales bacterium]NGZ07169.1 hypothetical protein [Magnetococcales bacterium]
MSGPGMALASTPEHAVPCFPLRSEAFLLLVEHARRIGQALRLLEGLVQGRDFGVIVSIQERVAAGERLRAQFLERVRPPQVKPFEQETLYPISLTLDEMGQGIANISSQLASWLVTFDRSMVELCTLLRRAMEGMIHGLEQLHREPDAVERVVLALGRAHRSIEKQYRLALMHLMRAEDVVQAEWGAPESVNRLFEMFRRREIYQQMRTLGKQIGQVGSLLHAIPGYAW